MTIGEHERMQEHFAGQLKTAETLSETDANCNMTIGEYGKLQEKYVEQPKHMEKLFKAQEKVRRAKMTEADFKEYGRKNTPICSKVQYSRAKDKVLSNAFTFVKQIKASKKKKTNVRHNYKHSTRNLAGSHLCFKYVSNHI